MSIEYHNQALQKLCRICGRLNGSNTDSRDHSAVECTEYRKELESVLQINTWLDEADCHPTKLCWRCVGILKHIKYNIRETSSTSLRSTCITEWRRHSRTGSCTTCNLFEKQLRGGRPPKRKRSGKGLPNVTVHPQDPCFLKDYDKVLHPFNLQPSDTTFTTSYKLDILGKDPQVETIFICAICQELISC